MSKTLLPDSEIVIRNLDDVLEEKANFINKHPRAPRFPFRICVSGPSSCGKTNFVLEMIINYLYYDKIYFYSTSLEQGKYKKLKQFYKLMDEEIKEIWKKENESKQKKVGGKMKLTGDDVMKEPEPIAEFVNIDEGMPNIDGVDGSKQNILVFDDCILCKDQSAFIDFFVRGRHKGCACIYLTQEFHAVPKMIRKQLTDVIFYTRPSTHAMNAIACGLGSGAGYPEFKEIFKRAVRKPFDFLHVDLRATDMNKRFRRNMNECINYDEVIDIVENKGRRKKIDELKNEEIEEEAVEVEKPVKKPQRRFTF
jgi:hypothetical protein